MSRKTYLVYGSCQGPALGRVLDSCPAFSQDWERVHLPPCHEISEAQLHYVIAAILPRLDLLIYQPVSVAYRGEMFSSGHLRRQLPTGTPALSYPYLHWEGYMPSSTPHAWGLDTYHDMYVDVLVADVARRRAGFDTFINAYQDLGGEFQRQLAQIEQWGVGELRQRESETNSDERVTDVVLSDYIAQHWRQQLLFYTANHPSRPLFEETARRLMNLLGYAPQQAQFPQAVDPLDSVQLPILPRLGLRFPFRAGQHGWYGYGPLSPTAYYAPMYHWFSTFAPEQISTFIERASYQRPWINAELAYAPARY